VLPPPATLDLTADVDRLGFVSSAHSQQQSRSLQLLYIAPGPSEFAEGARLLSCKSSALSSEDRD